MTTANSRYSNKFFKPVGDKRLEDKQCIADYGEDLPESHNWKWGNQQ